MNAMMMIPIGFRFDPTDEELIEGFLWQRLLGLELPCDVIAEKDLYGDNAAPWEVFDDTEGVSSWREGGATKTTFYAFTTLRRVPNSKRVSRVAGGGTWSGQNGKTIKRSDTGEMIGHMKMFSFQHSASSLSEDDSLGHWIMHEYSLSADMVKKSGRTNAADLVLCRITKSIKNAHVSNKRPAEEECSQKHKKLCHGCGGINGSPVEDTFFDADSLLANCNQECSDIAAQGSNNHNKLCDGGEGFQDGWAAVADSGDIFFDIDTLLATLNQQSSDAAHNNLCDAGGEGFPVAAPVEDSDDLFLDIDTLLANLNQQSSDAAHNNFCDGGSGEGFRVEDSQDPFDVDALFANFNQEDEFNLLV